MSSLLRVIFDPDTTPPGIPTILSVLPVGQGRLDIAWTPVTDTGGSGLAGYDLLKDGTTVIALGVQTSYSDTGLAAGSNHNYRVRSRDQAGNPSSYSTQASGTAAVTPATYNPDYPRFGSYAVGGTQNASNAALAENHVNIVAYGATWAQRKGITLEAKAAAVKALSTIGTKILPYVIHVDALDSWGVAGSSGNDFYEWYSILGTNNWFVYNNGLTHDTKVVGSATGWSKPNYTTSCPVVAGDTAFTWKAKWDYRLLYSGGTFYNGVTNVVVAGTTSLDGKYDDNIFARERSAGDYNVDGVSDSVSSATNISLIQASHAANVAYWQTLAPSSSLIMANCADWPIWYPGGLTGLPLDQLYDGGVLENIDEFINGVRGSTAATLFNAIKVCQDAFRGSKLGVLEIQITAAANYAQLRYWHCIAALTGTYYYPHVSSGYLAEELGTLNYDERGFGLGAALSDSTGAVQWTPRYQSGANGTGIYRRDFANGIVLWAAPGATYGAQALGGTFYRLSGSLDATTNNGQSLTSVTLAGGTGLVLARTSQVVVPSGAPRILFHANNAGPRTGADDNNGTYVFLYVLNAPTFAELGVTAFITIGDRAVAGYCHVAEPNSPRLAAMGVKRIAFQVGALTGLVDGTAYQIKLTTSAGTSNLNNVFNEPITFTPQPGSIVFVDEVNGIDGAAGTKAAPIKRLQNSTVTAGALRRNGSNSSDGAGENGTPPGTHVILRGGPYSLVGNGNKWCNLYQITGRDPTGAANRGPICIFSYPGAPGSNAPEQAFWDAPAGMGGGFNGNDSTQANIAVTAYGGGSARGWCHHIQITNIKIRSSSTSASDAAPVNMQCRATSWRVIDNDLAWPCVNQGFSAGVEGSSVNGRFFGNHIHDIQSGNQVELDTNHAFYFDGYGSGTTTNGAVASGNIIAFNDMHDITAGNGVQFFDNTNGAGMSNNTVAFNWIKTVSKHCINIADNTASCVVYNNVLEDAGRNSVRIATSALTTANGILVYNNVCYGWARLAGLSALLRESNFSGSARFENNVVCQKPGHAANGYSYASVSGTGTLTLSSNQWYDPDGRLTTKPASDSAGAHGNPLFTNAPSGDFTLANGSPCIDTGNTPAGTRAYGLGVNTAPQGTAHDRGAYER